MTRFALTTLCAVACAFLLLLTTGCGGGDGAMPFAPTSACTPKVVTVALLGDSTMVGMELFNGAYRVAPHNPGVQLQADMDARFGAGAVIVTDYGVSGSRAAQGNHEQADVVVVNYGINDFMHGDLPTYSSSMLALHPTLVETQSPVPRDPGNASALPYVEVARSLGLPVADTFAFVQTVPKWQDYFPDGVHPNDAMYILIVNNVLAPAVSKQVASLRCEF